MRFSQIIQPIKPLLVIVLVITSAHARATDGIANNSFSSFGIGIQVLGYQEDFSGIDFNINSSTTPISVVQYSGAYTAINDTDGFYINTTSPLFNVSSTEDWEVSPGLVIPPANFPNVQSNHTELGLSHINLFFSRLYAPGQQARIGVRYSTHNFTRYNFSAGLDAQDFNQWLIDTEPDNLDYADGIAFAIPGCTNDTSPPVYEMACTSVAILEQVSTLSLSIGYKYDTYFIRGYTGPRFSFATTLATPIFYIVNNTLSPGTNLIGSFGGGYDISTNLSLAIIDKNSFQLNLGMDAALMHRNQVSLTSSNLTYPNSDTYSVTGYLSFDWSF